MSKAKVTAILGAVSAFFGSIGAAITSLGLCACVLAPIISFVGAVSIVMGFLAKTSYYLIAIGAALLISSFILHKKSKVCAVHKKKK